MWRIYASVSYSITGSDNGLQSVQRQAIVWTNADLLSIRGPYFNDIQFELEEFSLKKMHLEMSSAW